MSIQKIRTLVFALLALLTGAVGAHDDTDN